MILTELSISAREDLEGTQRKSQLNNHQLAHLKSLYIIEAFLWQLFFIEYIQGYYA